MIHALLALLFCLCIVFFKCRTWLCLWPAVFYVSREFAQAEYRFVIKYCHGSFAQMPTFAGFSPVVWDKKSMLDWILPLCVSLVFFYFYRRTCTTKKT